MDSNSINKPAPINRPHIPQKFVHAKKTFVDRIADNSTRMGMKSFSAFPSDVDFNGKEPGESVVLVVRMHPAVFLPQLFLTLALLFAPILFFAVLSNIGISQSSVFALGMGATIMFILLAITVIVDTFLKWFFTVNIVTDQRVIDVDFKNVLYHVFAESQLERIEDVTHTVTGFLGSVFDYGSVYIQTAGSKPEFEFQNIPRPRDVQDTLLDLLEMKQKEGSRE